MEFADLYRFAAELPGPEVSLKELAKQVQAFHPVIGAVEFWAVDLDQSISLGHMVYDKDRDSPYADEFTVASIRLDRRLNRCWRRFVGCKELMHVFDSPAARADNREKFVTLLRELERKPLIQDMSPMAISEANAYWMAIVVLCPEHIRNKMKQELDTHRMTAFEVATRLRIPEKYIPAIMSEYYDRVLDGLKLRG